ncbi:TetR/AcrR family transcriptional regulator [Candidatus Marithrix sp. Canyon 246]|uniref:TetR/AcrR family transcriptional regulator n=1 Tax=Candidatus Marithrix sp. Canyon 246 TaxID=1827136 RepID=UPI00084A23D7|nr:TetR/AcrR family transcriptional regulator [Candidatus Marithrix sp. Canyon 246]
MPVTKTDKETIIKKSIHLFKVHGYYNTTMANIGDTCGLIKGSIYHHFKSKEALAFGCLRYIHEYFNTEIFSIAYRKNMSSSNKLEAFTKAVETYLLNSEGGCLLGNFALEISNNIPSLKKEIKSYFDHWEEALCEILKSKFIEQVAQEKAKQIIASTQGSIMMMRLYDSPHTFKNQNNEIKKLLS